MKISRKLTLSSIVVCYNANLPILATTKRLIWLLKLTCFMYCLFDCQSCFRLTYTIIDTNKDHSTCVLTNISLCSALTINPDNHLCNEQCSSLFFSKKHIHIPEFKLLKILRTSVDSRLSFLFTTWLTNKYKTVAVLLIFNLRHSCVHYHTFKLISTTLTVYCFQISLELLNYIIIVIFFGLKKKFL